jgi:hypothetical protein
MNQKFNLQEDWPVEAWMQRLGEIDQQINDKNNSNTNEFCYEHEDHKLSTPRQIEIANFFSQYTKRYPVANEGKTEIEVEELVGSLQNIQLHSSEEKLTSKYTLEEITNMFLSPEGIMNTVVDHWVELIVLVGLKTLINLVLLQTYPRNSLWIRLTLLFTRALVKVSPLDRVPLEMLDEKYKSNLLEQLRNKTWNHNFFTSAVLRITNRWETYMQNTDIKDLKWSPVFLCILDQRVVEKNNEFFALVEQKDGLNFFRKADDKGRPNISSEIVVLTEEECTQFTGMPIWKEY